MKISKLMLDGGGPMDGLCLSRRPKAIDWPPPPAVFVLWDRPEEVFMTPPYVESWKVGRYVLTDKIRRNSHVYEWMGWSA